MEQIKGKVLAICVSSARGTEKHPVAQALLRKDYGIEGDAHAGSWHRQVSLLAAEKQEEFNRKGGSVRPGDFGENLLVAGIDFSSLPVGTKLRCGSVLLRITQIGKACHHHCKIYYRAGDCIMPREGVFAAVEAGGEIKTGDEMQVLELPAPQLTAAVITLSDKGHAGERRDTSGPRAAEMLEQAGYRVVEGLILPDDRQLLEQELINLADRRQVDLIVTTGGTGFSPRDTTPEATLAVATRNVPGIAEAIRYYSLQVTRRAMLGRGVSVLRNNTLIVNLPGSTKAVEESLGFIMDELEHGLRILKGSASECGR